MINLQVLNFYIKIMFNIKNIPLVNENVPFIKTLRFKYVIPLFCNMIEYILLYLFIKYL